MVRDQAPRLLISEFHPFSTNLPIHNHGSQNDLNLFTGHLTRSYREFQSIKQKAFVRNRANHTIVNSILGHLSPTTFHNKESWGQYARIIPFIPHPCHSLTSREHIFSSSVNLKSALFGAVLLRHLLAMCGYLT